MSWAIILRYWKQIAAAGVLALLVWQGYRAARHAYAWAYGNGYNAANARAEKIISEMAKGEAEAQAKARKTEQDKAAAVARIAAKYEQDKADAEVAGDRAVAELRNGTVRLQERWDAERATNRLSDAAAAARHADEIAQLREQGARDLVRVGAEADAQIRGLQDVVRADRD